MASVRLDFWALFFFFLTNHHGSNNLKRRRRAKAKLIKKVADGSVMLIGLIVRVEKRVNVVANASRRDLTFLSSEMNVRQLKPFALSGVLSTMGFPPADLLDTIL